MAYRYYSTLRPLMVGGIPFPKQPGESITTISFQRIKNA